MSYFKHFPTINYNGSPAKNILARVKINDKTREFQNTYYPYTVSEEERLDHVAFNYYDDPHMWWLIMLANDMIDPWFDFVVSEDDFLKFIKKKYGSIADANKKILFYRNDWSADDQILTVSGFEALTDGQKKYWDPVLSFNDSVVGYERKRRDYTASTNFIQSADIDSSNGTLVVGERVVRDDDSSTSAFVAWANSSAYTYHHVVGDFSSNSSYSVTGETSGSQATINAATVSTIKEVIPSDELAYYSPVYAFDYERELNEEKKEINLIESGYVDSIEKDMKRLMKE